ncbi:class I SAM-dependent methyltransferase, partial [Simkania negevensis]|nr:class I SAM-dependent methyltransferase [Simkania negevensis]
MNNLFGRGKKRYVAMQKIQYQQRAAKSNYGALQKEDCVVGSYDAHNQWEDYDTFLMKYVDESFKKKVALDFACGPGRNIVKFRSCFARIDGADISQTNLENAKENLRFHDVTIPRLFVTSGVDCGDVEDETYHFIFSAIALQHICVHTIRYEILTAIYRALKKGGRISIQ